MLLILMDTREVDSKDMGAAGGMFLKPVLIGFCDFQHCRRSNQDKNIADWSAADHNHGRKDHRIDMHFGFN